MDANIMDMTLKWILLIAYFLILITFFRNRLSLEGVPGYLEVVLIIVPLNLILSRHIGSQVALDAMQPIALLLGAAFFLNVTLLLICSRLAPGVVASSVVAICVFSALFSLGSLITRFVIVTPVSSWG